MSRALRTLEPKDMPRLIHLHEEQNARDGTFYPLPRIFHPNGHLDPNIALALAIERNGALTQGVYFQTRLAEMCMAGCDPAGTALVRREARGIAYTLRSLGIRGLVTHIPATAPEAIGGGLMRTGFRSMAPDFATYFLDLDERET